LIFNLTTISESINFDANGVSECLSLGVLGTSLATHVVCGIEWGSRNVFSVKHNLSHQKDFQDVKAHMKSELSIFKTKFKGGLLAGVTNTSNDTFDNSFSVDFFGDVNTTDALLPMDLSTAAQFLRNIPKYISSANGSKGKPLVYTLLPISELSSMFQLEGIRDITMKNINSAIHEKFVQLFDEIASIRQELNDYQSFLLHHQHYIPKEHIQCAKEQIQEAKTRELTLQFKYKEALKKVRMADPWTEGSPDSPFEEIIEEFMSGDMAIHQLAPKGRLYQEKIQIIDGLVAKGAKYIGFNSSKLHLDLGLAIGINRALDVYVFRFCNPSHATGGNSQPWTESISLMHQLLDSDPNACVLLFDCDAVGEKLSQPRVSLYRNGEETVEDFLEDQKRVRTRCTARYEPEHLDRSSKPKPTARIAIRMACPGSDCKLNAIHDWICATCYSIVEYGHDDEYIYCECGRCDFRYWSFRCSNRKHGPGYFKYNMASFVEILKNLEPFEEFNILILGPTGVGKSTWINALINYLVFPSLDDALKTNELKWVIPFAFHSRNPLPSQEFDKVKISYGFGDGEESSTANSADGCNENDGSAGESATQKAAVHRVRIGKHLIRLIDTPGICDTRGTEQDKRNLANILSVVRTYRKLHGVLILLKPNDPRLDPIFKFCIQELLSHLHRDAARNIAFGFTNTVGYNYLPGETLNTLEALLAKFKDIGIVLRTHNVFCFDSMSFKYLAAMKQWGRPLPSLGTLEQNRQSWDYSVAESKRLIDYVRSLKAHDVSSTVNLYEIRHRIISINEPIVAIREKVASSINANKKSLLELSNCDATEETLRKNLKTEVQSWVSVRIDKPRTTCAEESCLAYAKTGVIGQDGKETIKVVYKAMCHNPCYLDSIRLDSVGHAGLRSCAAMNGTSICTKCKHGWISHLHVNYVPQEGIVVINDVETMKRLEKNKVTREDAEASIAEKKQLILELEQELKTIGDAAPQFGAFLKQNAIIAYNDETKDYLERLIRAERGAVAEGGSADQLNSLTQYLQQYEQQKEVLEKYMEENQSHKLLDQVGVENLLRELYGLKHYGKSLQKSAEVVQAARAVVYRERPYLTQAKRHWTGVEEEPAGQTEVRTHSGGFQNWDPRRIIWPKFLGLRKNT
jgi:GTPase SAR1 family protein